ncbi:hypothetical protein F4781DRAFT_308811 [Annulohypoxylon bovei var. microspora]|nr:hypothetical protein F4781DRAFT_308811 [Annulohypoxylon bovei var. microspora]
MLNIQEKRKAKPIFYGQAPRLSSSSSSSSSKGKHSPQLPKPEKTIAAPKPDGHKGRRSYESIPRSQHYGRPLEIASLLNNPRLQQVTGLHPRRTSWWNGTQPPIDELARLQWVMSLPDTYPGKRPKGNF